MKRKIFFINFLAIVSVLTLLSCQNPVTPEPEKQKSEDEIALEEAVKKLTITTEVESSVIRIELPSKIDNATISWLSSNSEIISTVGTVKHSNKDTDDSVTLTAILKLNNTSTRKDFVVTVKNKTFTNDQNTLNTIKDKLILNPVITPVDKSIQLTTKLDGATITWASSDNSIIDTTTQIDPKDDHCFYAINHKDENITDRVMLTATLKLNDAVATKDFYLQVQSVKSDETFFNEAVNSYKFPITEIGEDIDNIRINERMDYPYQTISLSCVSQSKDIITSFNNSTSFNITHTPGAGDQRVVITVNFSKNSLKASRDFTVIVKNPLSIKDQDKNAAEAVKNNLTIPTTIEEDILSIELPSKLYGKEYEEVVISWVSNSDVISTDGKVTHKVGEKAENVKLTATIKKGETKLSKEFNITVLNPKSEITDVLAVAVNNLTAPAFKDITTFSETINLPENITIGANKVNITWELINAPKEFILNNYQLTMNRNIKDVTGSIRATLTFDTKTATKDFSVTIPAYTLYGNNYTETREFINNYFYIKHYENKVLVSMDRYTVSKIDTENNTITMKWTDFTENSNPNVLISWKEASDKNLELLNKIIDKGTVAENQPTIENLHKFYCCFMEVNPQIPILTLDEFYQQLMNENCFADDILTVEQAKNISKEEEAKVVNKYMSDLKKSMFEGQNGETPWKDLEPLIKEEAVRDYPYITYKYTTTSSEIYFEALYDNSKNWYEQNGCYRVETEKGIIALWSVQKILVYHIKDGPNSISSSPYCSVKFSENRNSFTLGNFDNPDPNIPDFTGTWNVTYDTTNKQITIKRDDNTSYTLTFKGEDIS